MDFPVTGKKGRDQSDVREGRNESVDTDTTVNQIQRQ